MSQDPRAFVTEAAVLQALRAVRDPEQGKDVVTLGLVRDVEIQDSEVSFTLAFSTQTPAARAALHAAASNSSIQRW